MSAWPPRWARKLANFEVQILDSFGKGPSVWSCGAVYGKAAPLVNACKAPGYWQSYDVDYTPPRYVKGEEVAAAVVTVRHNGVLIHDKVEVSDPTGDGLGSDLARPGPVMLQFLGCP